MSEADSGSVIRIAIALAVLKHKPTDQSIASYLLDLHSRFPLATEPTDDRQWRVYALELEKQLAALKAQRDANQECPLDASQTVLSSDVPPPKKKSKKTATKDQHDPEWSWDQCRADWSRVLSSQHPLSPSLVAAYTSLKGALASPNANLIEYALRLAEAILRALDTVHTFLFSPTNPGPVIGIETAISASTQLKPGHIDSARIALASPVLVYVIGTTLHALVRAAQDITKSKWQRHRQQVQRTIVSPADACTLVDKVIDRLLEYILLCLLRALAPLCSARLAPLLSAPHRDRTGRFIGQGKEKGKDKDKRTSSAPTAPSGKTDARTDVFALMGTLLDALDTLPTSTLGPGARGCSIATDVRVRLGLEAIRELEALYATPPTPPAPPSTLQPPATPSEPPSSLPQPSSSSFPPASATHSQSDSQPQQPQPVAAQHVTAAQRLEKLAGTRAERIKALATRDAGWFLACTLNLCVAPAPPGTIVAKSYSAASRDPDPACKVLESSSELLREALLNRIGKLVQSSTPKFELQAHQNEMSSTDDASAAKFTIDPVCRNMLLAICERTIVQLILP